MGPVGVGDFGFARMGLAPVSSIMVLVQPCSAAVLPMKFTLDHSLSRWVAFAVCGWIVGFGSGCATPLGTARASGPVTGRVLTGAELRAVVPGAILGENFYAEVNSAWLPEWYPVFRRQLFRVGIVHWDGRFDCNRFADFYSNLAQAFFSTQMFHSETPAQALALGPFWYVRGDGQGRHAVIQALTERGRLFIDPQTGREIELTPGERQSGYVQFF